ncbi:hypothetical protein [Bradyrhizobium hipponense]|uniref:hypothetical protein n=1 Tax=Bradyrhizobium hipponense TaxID=2605638 RepID=UPI001652F968|nr:hypothetical protein [Bradyrhizobium hipponense]
MIEAQDTNAPQKIDHTVAFGFSEDGDGVAAAFMKSISELPPVHGRVKQKARQADIPRDPRTDNAACAHARLETADAWMVYS